MNKNFEEIEIYIKELRKVLTKWSKEYYINDSPTVDDSIYDEKLKELFLLEEKYPWLISKDSPTQTIGSTLLKTKFKKIKHNIGMLSLKNAFNNEDLYQFDSQIKSFDKKYSYFVEPKIDGLSISLIYKFGRLIQAITRGDGISGEDVTENVSVIENIPLTISIKDEIEVRGEIYMPISQFKVINDERIKNEEKTFANPRNSAAGTLRQLNKEIVKERNLKMFAYWASSSIAKEFIWESQSETILNLKAMGFSITESLSRKCDSMKDVISFIEIINEKRNQVDYEIDGIVVKVNNSKLYPLIGSTTKFPKWAIAYKFPAIVKETKLLNIFQTVGRTGKVTYNATLSPVEISGTLIQRATLHNAEYVRDLDLRVGDIVRVKKAGEIIPKVISVNLDKRSKDSKKWEEDKQCLTCLSYFEKEDDGVDQYCHNLLCESRLIESIIHFASREAMNIEGFSRKQIEKFVKVGWIKNFADIYLLKRDEVLELEGYQKKSVDALFNSIEKTKNNSLDRLIFALGIRHIGKKTAKDIAKHFRSIDELKLASIDDLLIKNDLGKVKVDSIVEYLKNKKNIEILDKLKYIGINPSQDIEQVDKENKFFNKKLVITGTIKGMTRTKALEYFESKGAKVTSSISKVTDYLIVAEKPSENKIEKIDKDKIIHIIDIDELNNNEKK